MTLKGWTNPLPQWLEDAVTDGRLVVIAEKDVEYLHGTVENPQKTIIQFIGQKP